MGAALTHLANRTYDTAMIEALTERDLGALAAAVVRRCSCLPTAEGAVKGYPKLDPKAPIVGDTIKGIRAGEDPLGEVFSRVRSPERRRRDGATYTPPQVVASMVDWAQGVGPPARIVDPGAGSGRFLMAAAGRFPEATLIGVECDPLAALLLRANVAAVGIERRTTVFVEDYRRVELPACEGQTLFIGNPPYVRHHGIEPRWKEWFAEAASSFGVKASRLAGLHIHFFVRTLQLAQDGDCGAFITSAEWLDVNYGAALRQLLAGRLGGISLHLLDPAIAVFADAITTSAITCFRVGHRPKVFRVKKVRSPAGLNGLGTGARKPWDVVARQHRWSTLVRRNGPVNGEYVELGELFRVHRGQVTGCNAVWIAGEQARGLPASVLEPTVTRARELFAAGDRLADGAALRKVIDLPSDLDELPEDVRPAVTRFLKWARRQGADQSYVARHRRAWWSVGLREPAPIVCTYMARRPPAFVRNLCGARLINVAHGLYPRVELTNEQLDAMAAWLRRSVGMHEGRTYAGGLTKFEPKEVERIRAPRPEQLTR